MHQQLNLSKPSFHLSLIDLLSIILISLGVGAVILNF